MITLKECRKAGSWFNDEAPDVKTKNTKDNADDHDAVRFLMSGRLKIGLTGRHDFLSTGGWVVQA